MLADSAAGLHRARTCGAVAGVALAPRLLRGLAGPVVDGFPLGQRIDCAATAGVSCADIVTLATKALNARESGHAAVSAWTVYDEDLNNPDLFDNSMLHTTSGGVFIVVFDLTDGSPHATCVYRGVGGCSGQAHYPH